MEFNENYIHETANISGWFALKWIKVCRFNLISIIKTTYLYKFVIYYVIIGILY